MGAAVPIISAVAAVIGAGSAAYGAYKSSKIKKSRVEPPPAMPEEAKVEPESQIEKLKRLLSGRKQTLVTTPGSLSPAAIYKPTLLGQ